MLSDNKTFTTCDSCKNWTKSPKACGEWGVCSSISGWVRPVGNSIKPMKTFYTFSCPSYSALPGHINALLEEYKEKPESLEKDHLLTSEQLVSICKEYTFREVDMVAPVNWKPNSDYPYMGPAGFNKISTIKWIKTVLGWGLRDSKEFVDDIVEHYPDIKRVKKTEKILEILK